MKRKQNKNLLSYRSPIKETKIYAANMKKKYIKKYKDFLQRNNGKKISDEHKLFIVKVYLNYKLMGKNFSKKINKLNEEVAHLVGISVKALKNIKNEFDIDTDNIIDKISQKYEEDRNNEQFKISENMKEPIKDFIINRGEIGLPTLTSHIREFLLETYDISVSLPTIWRSFKRFGFNYSKIICNDKNKQRKDIIEKRKEYCKKFYELYISDEYDIVYQDESYVCKNHVRGKSWAVENDFKFFKKPSGKGQRVVITGAINKYGFIKDSYEFWIANTKTDYHNNFTKIIFEKYFTTKLLPNLIMPSVIILDNAPYHKIYENEDLNPRNFNKNDLKKYLDDHNVTYNDKMLKGDLLDLALKIWKPVTKLEKMAFNDGLKRFQKPHILLFLPPYYPELNPIEFAWARIKNNIADNPT